MSLLFLQKGKNKQFYIIYAGYYRTAGFEVMERNREE